MKLQPPVFIVGAPRSGTTLLASMLAGHSRIACGPETQFFNKLSKARLTHAVNDPRWSKRALGLVTSLTLAGQPVYALFGHTPVELEAFLVKREPSVGAILESLTSLYASKRGKPRWAEKTPNHVLHLPKLRASYPDAPIIRIVRDPRDSALSMRKLPWASPAIIANGYLWTSWFEASQPFFERDPMALTVRYEDLVANPLATLTTICTFIGEGFETGTLESHKYGRSVASPNETWKAANAERLDNSRTGLWQHELDANTQRALGYICQNGLETFGYAQPQQPEHALASFPLTLRSTAVFEPAILQAAARGLHLASTKQPRNERNLLLLPILTGSRAGQLKMAAQLSAILLRRRLKGLTTRYLLPDSTRATWTQRLLFTVTRWLGTPYEARSVSKQPAPRAPAQPQRAHPSLAGSGRSRVRQPPHAPQQKGPHISK